MNLEDQKLRLDQQVYLGCHEEKRGAYTRLYKRQVM